MMKVAKESCPCVPLEKARNRDTPSKDLHRVLALVQSITIYNYFMEKAPIRMSSLATFA